MAQHASVCAKIGRNKSLYKIVVYQSNLKVAS